ncbi:shikimate kinase [Paenibacillus piri]|uniref:Shikimate kinase n=1 Tax=Paenibacillus piri TaxID=2547395 RepID=A0A4R5KPI6_9BACL|nr:shikimate kinase [Paenibacillus piri]TDF96560.1 shikimate kinase [Paenibacillus piri]
MNKANVVLIGFAGTGKSTVGRALAERLNWQFTDTDHRIEERYGISIAEIFKLHGEPEFRSAESKAIDEALAERGQVVSTGGGAVLAERNRTRMREGGFVVALTASKRAIIERVSQDQSRPLVQGNVEEKVTALMESRKHAYDFADLKIDTSELSIEAIVDRIQAAL